MPLKHLRVCAHCNTVRFAACGRTCRVPHDGDSKNWRENMQTGAGTITPPEAAA